MLDSVLDTVGQTPLVKLRRLGQGLGAEVACKLESWGPASSGEDRIARATLARAEAKGWLQPGSTVIEAGSGNLGLALAAACAVLGHRLLYVTDDQQAAEKVGGMKAFGAEVIVCPHAVQPEDPRSKQSVAQRLSEESPDAYYAAIAEEPETADLYAASLGPEVWEATGGRITHLFAPVGTGATISGVGRHLKRQRADVRVIGVEPIGSVCRSFLASGRMPSDGAGTFLNEEIGSDVPPTALDLDAVDEVLQVSDRDALRTARTLAKSEAILTGGAGGATVAACLRALRDAPQAAKGAVCVCLIPDSGLLYLSKVYSDAWMQENRFLDDRLDVSAAEISAHKRGGRGREEIPDLVAVQPHSLVIEAVELMRRYGISQIPVIDGEEVVGSVKEDRLLHLLMADRDAKTHPVKDVLDEPFPVLDAGATIEEISARLTGAVSAVLIRGPEGFDIITKADLIRTFARRG